MSTVIFNSFNVFFLIAYLLSAAVQYNDPDAAVWVAVYLVAAGMCVARLRQHLPVWLPRTLLVICLAWIGLLLPSIVGKVSVADIVESVSMKTRAVEEAREIGGLLLVVIWSAVLAFPARTVRAR